MKKSFVVLALAVALILLFAATAMARPNGDIYISWDAGGPNAGTGGPHQDYQLTTEKCNVCHSVHYAAPANYTWAGTTSWTSGENTQMLLRSSVAEACNYCHIETSIGGVQLYGGIVANYTNNNGFNHSVFAPCSGCHAVHGANTYGGGNATKVLRVRNAPYAAQADLFTAEQTSADIDPIWANRAASYTEADKYLQQVAFCTQCHKEYTTASEATIPDSPGYWVAGSYDGNNYKGHPMKSAGTTFAADGANFFGQVAWVDSDTCRSCHDAGGVNQAGVTFNSFPHYTQGYYVFSDWALNEGAAGAGPDNARENSSDGNCLKCHVNAGSTSGVNITY
jgi:hypothetical protein